mgnify:CR=1 FL=1
MSKFISESEKHNCIFEMSISSVKYNVPFNIETNQNETICNSKIKLCEVFSSKRVDMTRSVYPILNCGFV